MKKIIIATFLVITAIVANAQSKLICIQPSCKQTIKTTDSVNIFAQLTTSDGYKGITWTQILGPTIAIPVQTINWTTNVAAQSVFTLKNLNIGTYVFNAIGTSTGGSTVSTYDTLVVVQAPKGIAYVMTVYTDSSRVKTQ